MTGGQHQVIQQYNCDNYALLAICVYVYGGLRDDSNDNEESCDFLCCPVAHPFMLLL